MRVNETHSIMLGHELRAPRPLLSAQQWQQGSCHPPVVDQACRPDVDFAHRQARKIFAARRHIAGLACAGDADANKSWTISRARAARGGREIKVPSRENAASKFSAGEASPGLE